ncbi:Cullin-4, partial [Cladochytrium tenue]
MAASPARATPAGPAKKLVVKGLKVKPQLPSTFVEETWGRLRAALTAIFSGTAMPVGLEELYRACEALCICKQADMMYTKLLDVCRSHAAAQRAALKSNGDQVRRESLRALVAMLSDLGLYASVFEAQFLEVSDKFYCAEGNRLAGGLEAGGQASSGGSGAAVADYLAHVEARLVFERNICSQGVGYLSAATRKPLCELVERQLVKKHASVLLEKGFDSLLTDGRVEDLARMYTLLVKVGELDDLKKHFTAYVEKTAAVIVCDASRDATMVADLLELKRRVDAVLSRAFQGSEVCGHAEQEAFERSINRRANKPAELIAKHVDGLLRSGKGVAEEDTEAALDQCLVLFRFIN